MTSATLRFTVAVAALCGVAVAPAIAQRQAPATPEQRIERLENQLRQVQRRVFPRGQPADTAGLADEPAATQASVRSLDDRLGALERQLAEVLRLAEENGNRTRQVEAELGRLRTQQDNRISALESALSNPQPVQPAAEQPAATTPRPSAGNNVPAARPPAVASSGGPADAAEDPAEIAYDEGYQLWRQGRFDQAITSLRATASAFPKHRRASWANNLVGRALLDKGEPRAAAEALLANYRANPRGERAADSLFYLGQALARLNQPAQACKAYAELEAVYGSSIRAELQRLLPPAKAAANC